MWSGKVVQSLPTQETTSLQQGGKGAAEAKKLPKLRVIPTLFFFTRIAENNFFESLTISCAGGEGHTRRHRFRPARSAEAGLLFLAQGGGTHTPAPTSAGA